jgi:type II secretory pathway component PulM
MTSYLDRLNLRPFEKRLVVGVGAVLFVVLNAWFVVPHFSDLSEAKKRRADAIERMKRWQAEIDQKAKYELGISKLVREGQEVQAEDQVNQFARAIQEQQAKSGVGIGNFGRTTTKTNQFFLELTQPVSVQSGEAQLVDFLYSLGSGNSLIRVSELTLRPDPPRQQLSGQVKLVASFQKTAPKKAASANAKVVTTTAKRP